MKIYFVTHSTSEDNEAGLASGWHDRNYLNWVNSKLGNWGIDLRA